ncbi:MAG: hypothetical protein H6684_00355 [Deltaproteobacteria bacterium]|nr:hypothetical protein [bacterium]MCB9476023.1 hypothetical protein [Deltaproteobacteria bacterium]MCB9478288.1 hypothetical protein [Deltaproteobacteria bacterium]MCB9487160.1 hypothetical protein [Deltaproteobacteria bacterium]
MSKLTIIVLATALAVLAFSAAPALAQQDSVEVDSIVIEGRILRPQVAYMIQRANVEFGVNASKTSFIHKIEESIEEEPF